MFGKGAKGAKAAEALVCLLAGGADSPWGGWDRWDNSKGGKGGKHKGKNAAAEINNLCGACGEYGHFRKQCWAGCQQCEECGGYGHVAKACKKRLGEGKAKAKGQKGQKALAGNGQQQPDQGGKGGKGKKAGAADGAQQRQPQQQQQQAASRIVDGISWAEVAKECWVCTGCGLESSAMTAKACTACGKPRKKVDEEKPRIYLTEEEKKLTRKWAADADDGEWSETMEHYDLASGDEQEQGEREAPLGETEEDKAKRKRIEQYLKLAEACREAGESEEAAKWDKKAQSAPKPKAARPESDIVELNRALLRKEEIKEQDLEKYKKDKKTAEEAIARMKKERERKLKEAKDQYDARVRQVNQSMDDADARLAKEMEELETKKVNLLKSHEETCAELQNAIGTIRQKREHGAAGGNVAGEGATGQKPAQEIVVKAARFDTKVLTAQYLKAGMTQIQINALLAIQLAHLNSISEVQTVGGGGGEASAVAAAAGTAATDVAPTPSTPAEQAQAEATVKEQNWRTQVLNNQISQQQFDQLMGQMQVSLAARITELTNQASMEAAQQQQQQQQQQIQQLRAQQLEAIRVTATTQAQNEANLKEQNWRVQVSTGQLPASQCEQLVAQSQAGLPARITELANQAMHQAAATAGQAA